MLKTKISPQTLLSTLWIFVVINMIFRDIHQLAKIGFLEEIMTGLVNGIKITDELMLIGGLLAEISIMMVLLSRILDDNANRWANIIGLLFAYHFGKIFSSSLEIICGNRVMFDIRKGTVFCTSPR